jgi:hypothetical protein
MLCSLRKLRKTRFKKLEWTILKPDGSCLYIMRFLKWLMASESSEVHYSGLTFAYPTGGAGGKCPLNLNTKNRHERLNALQIVERCVTSGDWRATNTIPTRSSPAVAASPEPSKLHTSHAVPHTHLPQVANRITRNIIQIYEYIVII